MNRDDTLHDAALLAARLALGGTMIAHGSQKVFGALGGPGLKGVAQMTQSLGFEPAEAYAQALSAAELGSGALITAGLLGPVGPAALISVMLVAIETVHRPKGFFATQGGLEMNLIFIMLALLLASEGYGSLSLDELIGLRRRLRSIHGWLTVFGGVAGAIAVLARRKKAATPA